MSKALAQTSLQDLLPSSITRDGKVQAAAEAVDEQLQAVQVLIPVVQGRLDLSGLSDAALDLLAWERRADMDFYDPSASRSEREQKVADSLLNRRRDGTRSSVKEVCSGLAGEEFFEYRQRKRFRLGRTKLPGKLLEDERRVFLVDLIADHDRVIALGLERQDFQEAIFMRKTEGCVHRVRFRGFKLGRSLLGLDLLR